MSSQHNAAGGVTSSLTEARVLLHHAVQLVSAAGRALVPSPGDDAIPEPYFYVTPWPPPAADEELPPLGSGVWHREGWTGALLRAQDLPGPDESRSAHARAFLAGAVGALETRHAKRAG